jgi:hypothetical protein
VILIKGMRLAQLSVLRVYQKSELPLFYVVRRLNPSVQSKREDPAPMGESIGSKYYKIGTNGFARWSTEF